MTEEQVAKATAVRTEDWKQELPLIEEWLEQFGEDLPTELWAEYDGLKARLDATN
jgi:phosphoenolpyruvate carboxykinase (GTP)